MSKVKKGSLPDLPKRYDSACTKCIFRSASPSQGSCNYMAITGHSRIKSGYPHAGADCGARIEGPMMTRKSYERARKAGKFTAAAEMDEDMARAKRAGKKTSSVRAQQAQEASDKAWEAYAAGALDEDIAERVNRSVAWVSWWRQKNHLRKITAKQLKTEGGS